VGTLDRAAGILIRRLVQRPRLYEVGGVEASGKQPQTGASRSRACFAPALLAQDRCQLEPGRPLLPSVGAVGRIEVKSEALAKPRARRPESNSTISGLGQGQLSSVGCWYGRSAPKLRKWRVRPSSYAWCQKLTSRLLAEGLSANC
jgi:hypothetical protein